VRHVLKHPHYPDLVEAWAEEEQVETVSSSRNCVNDNDAEVLSDLSDPFLELLARIDIAETRCW
jgi:hypothetical protein